jgi:hypothetical protein
VTLSGSCHCGNLALRLETAVAPEELPVRACACAFCRKQGARATSDPAGRVEILVRDRDALIRHRFALRTADFLVCGRCGVYVAAVLAEGDAAWATVNVNVLEAAERFARDAAVVSYDGETEAARRARRRATWTPARVR